MTDLLMEPLRNFGDGGLVVSLNRLLRGFGANTSVVIEAQTQTLTRRHVDGWFWTEEWQAGEREVDLLVSRGEVSVFDDIDDFLAHFDETIGKE